MRGHTRKRGKSWSYVIDVGIDPETHKRRQKWVGGHRTRDDAEKALRTALRRLDVGDDPFPEKISFEVFAKNKWLPHLRAQGKPRPSTLKRYEQLLDANIIPKLGGMRLDRIKPAHVQAALDAMSELGLAPRTVGQARAVMSSVFQCALRWQLVTTNPVRATTSPTPQPPKLKTPNGAELRAVINAARKGPWEIGILLAASTGARRSEVLGLRWKHVDLEKGRIRITETLQRLRGEEATFVAPKTAAAHREIPLPAFVVERLRRHKTDQARRRLALGAEWADLDLVVERGDGAPLDPDSFSHGFQRVAKKAGLEGVRLHDCRHGVATELARSGVPAFVTSKVLGHSSVAFTASVYQHADDEMVDRALAGLESALNS